MAAYCAGIVNNMQDKSASPQNQPTDPLIGQTIASRYRIVSALGSGGMGVLYKAINLQLDKPVALKMVKRNLIGKGDQLRRLHREASVLASLEHPNIVRINAVDIDQEGHCLVVMQYLDGVNLDQYIERNGPLSIDQFKIIFEQVCAGLTYAHQRGIVHRDLKPSNLMLVGDKIEPGCLKIVDFGLARLIDEKEAQKLTSTGAIVGSVNYMSPEQTKGGGIDARTDVYSLACVMYNSLTGVTPFAADTAFAAMYKHGTESLAPIPGDGVEAISSVLTVCTAVDPEDRFQSVQDMWEAIQNNVIVSQRPLRHAKRRAKIPIPALAAIAACAIAILGIATIFSRPSAPPPSDEVRPDEVQLFNAARKAVKTGQQVTYDRCIIALLDIHKPSEPEEEEIAQGYLSLASSRSFEHRERLRLARKMVWHYQTALDIEHANKPARNTGKSDDPLNYNESNHIVVEIPTTMNQNLTDLGFNNLPEGRDLINQEIASAQKDGRHIDESLLRFNRAEQADHWHSKSHKPYTAQSFKPIEDDILIGLKHALKAMENTHAEDLIQATRLSTFLLCNNYLALGRNDEAEKMANLWLKNKATASVKGRQEIEHLRDEARSRKSK